MLFAMFSRSISGWLWIWNNSWSSSFVVAQVIQGDVAASLAVGVSVYHFRTGKMQILQKRIGN